PEDPYLAVDPEKMERIFFNIMGNAFKFTRDNGRISVRYRVEGDKVRFSITDNGLGISEEDQKNIFDRFFEADRIHPNGSGLGLTLAKAFVEIHGGTIEVESLPGKGSEFIVEIPVRHVHREAAQPDPVQSITTEDIVSELSAVGSDDTTGDSSIPSDAEEDSDKPLLLVIDDNCDILNMMTGLMDDEYRVITASNGREGLRLAVKYVPDLVVCDVMMPVMDGLQCCRLIKEEVSTSHIPVLMLTACSLDEQRLSGYENGADGYVAKPFSIDLLRARCRSLVANRRRIRELFSAGKGTEVAVNAPSGNAAVAPTPDVEDEFYARFIKIVEEEMGNPDLSVDDLASRIGLGRSQFYRKIKALTNYSPVELLRRFRLQKARSMLTKTSRSISEVAYAVGFSSPAYFTRCYREAYGETPRELRERLTKK
ncbi:MAG: helix-turn-helix domain-containing protein, partial [Muribaculaceae bacterium]|nr:helix-turn-helix domain-containing protein [Muribaculaceae bacterium]